MKIESVALKDIKDASYNPRVELKPGDVEWERLKNSIEHFGYVEPIVVNKRGMVVVGGHQRLHVLRDLGVEQAEVVFVDLDENDEKALNVALNKIEGKWDAEKLEELMRGLDIAGYDIRLTGFDEAELNTLYNGVIEQGAKDTSSAAVKSEEDTSDNRHKHEGGLLEFCAGFFPFSILDTMSTKWVERNKMWKNIVKQHIERLSQGRKEGLTYKFARCDKEKYKIVGESTSVFDMTLCELIYSWFGFTGASILDPFAGGFARGFVASELGLYYTGIDLSKDQIDSNKEFINSINSDVRYIMTEERETVCKDPTWICDDSRNLDKYVSDEDFDLLFTCPPYADLEVYSDDPRDISNKSYNEFITLYKDILVKASKKLKNNRFAVIVVGEARGKDGGYYGFVNDTIKIMQDAGLKYYNEAILVNSKGTALFRSGNCFKNNRKMFKIHQNVLVFYKGDIAEIRNIYPTDKISMLGIPEDVGTEVTESGSE